MQTVKEVALAQLRAARELSGRNMTFSTEHSMACKSGMYLKYQWWFCAAPEDKAFARNVWWTHVKFCRQCRDEWYDCNRLARQPYTSQQEAAWEAEG